MTTALILLRSFQESQIEFWLPIEGFLGYDVSSFGRVRSYFSTKSFGGRNGFKSIRVETPRILKASAKPYVMLSLQRGDVEQTVTVHRLVAKAFIPNPQRCPEVNHKNLVKSDCRALNLEWTDHDGNHKHLDANGMRPKGFGHYRSVLSREQILEMQRLNRDEGIGLKIHGMARVQGDRLFQS